MKLHRHKVTGELERCRATKRPCPHGGPVAQTRERARKNSQGTPRVKEGFTQDLPLATTGVDEKRVKGLAREAEKNGLGLMTEKPKGDLREQLSNLTPEQRSSLLTSLEARVTREEPRETQLHSPEEAQAFTDYASTGFRNINGGDGEEKAKVMDEVFRRQERGAVGAYHRGVYVKRGKSGVGLGSVSPKEALALLEEDFTPGSDFSNGNFMSTSSSEREARNYAISGSFTPELNAKVGVLAKIYGTGGVAINSITHEGKPIPAYYSESETLFSREEEFIVVSTERGRIKEGQVLKVVAAPRALLEELMGGLENQDNRPAQRR